MKLQMDKFVHTNPSGHKENLNTFHAARKKSRGVAGVKQGKGKKIPNIPLSPS